VTELSVVIFFFVHTAVLSIKTAFNLVKIHLLFRILLIRKNAEASNGISLRHYNFRIIENLVPFLTDI